MTQSNETTSLWWLLEKHAIPDWFRPGTSLVRPTDKDRAEAAEFVGTLRELGWSHAIRNTSPAVWNALRDMAIEGVFSPKFCDEIFRGLDFRGRNLSQCRFEKSSLNEAKLRGCDLHSAEFVDVDLVAADLGRAWLFKAQFENCRAYRCSFRGARLRLAKFTGTDLGRADFTSAKDLFGDYKATIDSSENERTEWIEHHNEVWRIPVPRLLADLIGMHQIEFGFDRLVSWSLLRFVGTLRVFGLSSVAVLAVVLYAGVAEWYQHAIENAKTWLESQEQANQIWLWIHALPATLPIPTRLARQTVALLFLAVGAGIYKTRCPHLVQENTETAWTRRLGQSLFEYGSANWCNRLSRYVAGVCLLIGGGHTVIYFVINLVKMLQYLASAYNTAG